MIEFVEYVVSELKKKRLSKADAQGLLRQYSQRPGKEQGAASQLQGDASDLTRYRYVTVFTGDEFFLKDHLVQGGPVLPAVAYLELARSAISQAPFLTQDTVTGLELRNVVWPKPLVVTENTEVAVVLLPAASDGRATGEVDFEIHSLDGDRKIIHCQGRAVFSQGGAPQTLDIGLLRTSSTRSLLEAGAVYAALEGMGVEFGPALQSIVRIYRGDQQALSELHLPAAAEDLEHYGLHPSLMDGALQTPIGLVEDPFALAGQARVPFALESMRILGPCTQTMHAWARYSSGAHALERVLKFDIDLCDEAGNVTVQMRGLSSRILSDDRSVGRENRKSAEMLLAVPEWLEAPVRKSGSLADFKGHHAILCGLASVDSARLESLIPRSNCLSLQTLPETPVEQLYASCALACFVRIKAILESKPEARILIQIVVADEPQWALLAGLTGLLRTVSLENPMVAGQLILVPPQTTSEQLARLLREESEAPVLEPLVTRREASRQVIQWTTEEPESEESPSPFKDGGVYLITGGLGGLGVVFAREILTRTTKATVALVGRSALTGEKQALLDAFESHRVIYKQADLCDLEQVERVIAQIEGAYGSINGILHSAGVISDNFILKKTREEFTRVLTPKVSGTVNLDRAARNVKLDFFVLFSSVAGVLGNLGQSDYSAANGFMDQFSAYRNQQVLEQRRYGRTLSIDWGLWEEGGMGVDPATMKTIVRVTGMQPMRAATGLPAFFRAMATPHGQVLILEGDPARIGRSLRRSTSELDSGYEIQLPAPVTDAISLFEKAQDFLRREFSVVLRLPHQAIDQEAPLEKYGIDSILAMELTNRLEETFGSLPKTLFFEYQTIAALAEWFVQSHQRRLSTLLVRTGTQRRTLSSSATPAESRARPKSLTPSPANVHAQRRERPPVAAKGPATVGGFEPIAIIGLSGRYPEAIDIEAFWRVLSEGEDCIAEIPKDRWDWREYFTADRSQGGRHFSKWGGFISGVDEFDPLFFNIAPSEAELMDPQERLFLQHAWMALEDAGYTRASLQVPCERDLAGQVGVYAGVMYNEYQFFGVEASMRGKRTAFASNLASIANRVSYFLNVHGPSMTLDTMCSSSLTAIHTACQDLKLGRTSVAIAGGVNVTIHPNKYLMISGGQFISSEGHCQSFGEGGDGYIPAEGVGVVVLKRLSDAERDGDHIYGVIRGSALNHGGKTNGYSVPNPQAQTSVIRRALAEANLDPRHVSYIEAHGTGTKLGDPIEIAALTKAFHTDTQDTGFCPIGSVKSNIGHCESAAGIAGLTKVLLQMRHRQIVPSLHSAQLNPHIEFDQTPFVVNQTLRAWEQPVIEGRKLPRIAGISSFGAGGSNAHMIVEEYQTAEVPGTSFEKVAILLSARTGEQLEQKVKDLLEFVRVREKAIDLVAMAYTLQTGREGMGERLGLVVSSIEELMEQLGDWTEGGPERESVYRGEVKRNKEALSMFSTDADLRETIGKWIGTGKLNRLVELWVKGVEVDWSKLYGARLSPAATDKKGPGRISLPVYPFAKERYWIETPAITLAEPAAAPVLHPLLHSNTSDLSEQRYSTTLTGEEFFLADHQVELERHGGNKGLQKVLPGVAYLEMARAAIEHAWSSSGETAVLELENLAWMQPVVVDGANRQVNIGLKPEEGGGIEFEIYSGEGEHEQVHCQGRGEWKETGATGKVDLEGLRKQMSEGRQTAESIHVACARMGVNYGPAMRSIRGVERGRGQLLAELELPKEAEREWGAYGLHPSLLDGAWQACAGLMDDGDDAHSRRRLPFALETLRILGPCSKRMTAWVRYSPGSQATDAVVQFDIDLCDLSGAVCAQMRGFSSRLVGQSLSTAAAGQSEISILFLTSMWQTKNVDSSIEPEYAEHCVILCGLPQINSAELESLVSGSQCQSIESAGSSDLAKRYHDCAIACFERIQTVLRSKSAGKALVQIIAGTDHEHSLFAGLSGLLKTAALENPRFAGQLILVPISASPMQLALILRQEKRAPSDALIEYQCGVRRVLRWSEFATPSASTAPFKDRGVYLITGGRGGLGLLFAKEILARTREARVILTGRSQLPESAFESFGAAADRLSYRQIDVCDAGLVNHLIRAIKDEYQQLNGILHCAGVIDDSFLLKKEWTRFSRVLAPKVTGVWNLDQASQDIELDFFVLFSSISGAMGNLGQGDYAAANAFMDQFAPYRDSLVTAGLRHGRTVSINWPLWRDGGMGIDPTTQEALRLSTGIHPMRTATGMSAFSKILASPHAQVLVAEGDLHQMRRSLLAGSISRSETPEEPVPSAAAIDSHGLWERTQTYLCGELSALLKLPAHKLDPRVALEEYGIDSILAVKLTNHLERTFGPLPKTLFFEYQTIAALAGYFAAAHSAAIREHTGLLEPPVKRPQSDRSPSAETRLASPARRKARFLAPKTSLPKDVAIVGIAGKYPQAGNIREFWKNLQNGRDCVTEIPADRWDHAACFDPNKKPGKSYSKWGGFISGVDTFDPLFFNISPKDAELTDPQERLFLETAWHAIEDAGHSKESISRGRVGVFVGVMWSQYDLLGVESILRGGTSIPNSSHASIANRVSYFFDFQGPSIAVDTMCSSSLTAIHLACEELRKGEIDAAIAGGVNLTIHPYKYLSLSQGRFASSDGKCRSFGEGGDGYVPGEGVGAILLKRLDDAVRDGNHIYAVVKSSSVNHGGKTNGYSVPNPNAQGELILQALRKANIDPKTLGYVETHGTGTSLGDPIEIAGLLKAFGDPVKENHFCPIGSVKSNIGHLEAAAGIAAVTKAVLQIKHRQLVPSLHARPLNSNINFDASPFYVQTELAEWKHEAMHPRRVGVSSFGAGGSNAHLILEEYPATLESAQTMLDNTRAAFVLSARNQDALRRYAQQFVDFFDCSPDVSLADLAYTLQVGRTPMDVRMVVIASSLEDLKRKLEAWLMAHETSIADLADVYFGNVKDAPHGVSHRFLVEGKAGNAFVAELMANQELERIAGLWILGAEIDWSVLHRSASPKRISLPQYPFEKERCWLDAGTPSIPMVLRDTVSQTPVEEKSCFYYRPQWILSPLPLDAGKPSPAGPVLILDTSESLYLAMKQSAVGDPVILVKPGTEFQRIREDLYVLDPGREEDWRHLAADLHTSSRLPDTILHHYSGSCHLEDAQMVDQHLNWGVYALFALCQALIKAQLQASLTVISVFSSGPKESSPLAAAMAGFARTLVFEHPKWRSRVVEIQSKTQLSAAEIVSVVSREMHDQEWTTEEVHYRAAADRQNTQLARYTSQLSPLTVAGGNLSLPLKQNGVYLITGGLGGLGLHFAEYLAKQCRAKLVLLGRSIPSPGTADRIRRMIDVGADVLTVRGDVSKPEDMERLVREAKERFSCIDGVIHAAGVLRDALIVNKSRSDFEAVLAPKIHGVINLDLATSGETLDWFVLFSSVSGVLGNRGQCDYAFANRFLDAFSGRREEQRRTQQRSGVTLSIDWPLWEAGGMGLSAEEIALMQKRTGLSPLPVSLGIRCWEELLRTDSVQALVLYGHESKITPLLGRPHGKVIESPTTSIHGQDSGTLLAKTEAYLKTLIGAELKLAPERIGSSDRLEIFGMDSVTITRCNTLLERDLGALPKTLLYENETVSDLSAYLLKEARGALIARLGADGPLNDPVSEPRKVSEGPISRSPSTIDEDLDLIAIIGIHGSYPQSTNRESYWNNLKQGRDLVGLVPPARWDSEELYDPDPSAASNGKIYCKWGGFLEDHDKFDSQFFNIPGDEADLIDPQERLFLQSVWAAIEDAGYTRASLKQSVPKGKSADVGVFVGVTTNTYQMWAPEERRRGNIVSPTSLPWSIANRVSYFFDFSGPSLPIDTACSSSLVALHLASESLKRRECQVAIAGGVNLYLHPSKYQSMCRKRMLARDGKCRSYGTGDDGFVPGEGVGSVVLKPLGRAIRDQDRIYGLIRASAFDHSGRSNGYSAPNPNSQANLILETLAKGGVHPETIGCVEGHGTGTQLGDGIEISALSQAFRKSTSKNQFCPLGSVKANIGHLESAAGMAGLAKIVLQFEHRQLVPTIHSAESNPDVDFAGSPFYLQHRLTEWKRTPEHPRRALINAFGAGGVNACVILEEYEKPNASRAQAPGPYLFALSAKNEARLHEYANQLLTFLTSTKGVDLAGFCYTLQVGREPMGERLAAVVLDANDLIRCLADWTASGNNSGACSTRIYRGQEGTRHTSKGVRRDSKGPFENHRLDEIAELWANGEDLDWNGLYPLGTPPRISLPTYPFARERHWIPDARVPKESSSSEEHAGNGRRELVSDQVSGPRRPLPAPKTQLHPLVSCNSSTLKEVRYTSLLSDSAFYAVDHTVNGLRILPGAALLEIACIAGNIASEQRVSKISDLVWMQPLYFSNGIRALRTSLKSVGESVEYVISSVDAGDELVVHSEGRLQFKKGRANRSPAAERLSISGLKAQCVQREDGAACYRRFKDLGLGYGPSFQTIKEIYSSGAFALSRLELPAHLEHEFDQFILHPSIIDAAIQTAAGVVGRIDGATPHLPFALDEMELIGPAPQNCYAYAEPAARERKRAGVRKFNIKILNDNGDVLVKLNNLILRAVTEQPASPPLERYAVAGVAE